MFEVDAIHQGWLAQMRGQLDEVWVPSRWHAAALARQGVPPDKVAVVPESLDSALADPALWEPLPLPGKRGFAFLAVFKLEERKGWRELVAAYAQVGPGGGGWGWGWGWGACAGGFWGACPGDVYGLAGLQGRQRPLAGAGASARPVRLPFQRAPEPPPPPARRSLARARTCHWCCTP
jgi:hypothetical protein